MLVAVAQLNPTVGAITENVRQMRGYLARAREAGARAVVFPELCVPGYPPRDLLDRPHFVKEVLEATRQLVTEAPDDVALVLGTLGVPRSGSGLPLTNDAVVARGGREIARVSKQLLPTYDVFDEARHFRPGGPSLPVELSPGWPTLVTICEDAWCEAPELSGRYERNPLAALDAGGVRLLVNLSASPFTLAKRGRRSQIFRQLAQRHSVSVVMANQVGANDELIFDGESLAWSPEGGLLAQAARFEEDLLVVDLAAAGGKLPTSVASQSEEADTYAALVLGVRDYLRKCGFRSVVLGLSGGIDSALTACIAVDALGPSRVRGVAMPTRYSSPGSVVDARALARNLGIELSVVDIDPIFQAYIAGLGPLLESLGPARADDVSLENVQARARGATLMAISNRTGAMVLATGNKSELAVGYCTLYGDMAGGLSVIGDVPKSMVYRLAQHVNRAAERIPQSTLDKPPSAELRPNQKDQDSLPPYDELDGILELYVEDQLSAAEIVARGFERGRVERVLSLVRGAEHKRRQSAPGLIVTRKAFGLGRRMPVASAEPDAAAAEGRS